MRRRGPFAWRTLPVRQLVWPLLQRAGSPTFATMSATRPRTNTPNKFEMKDYNRDDAGAATDSGAVVRHTSSLTSSDSIIDVRVAFWRLDQCGAGKLTYICEAVADVIKKNNLDVTSLMDIGYVKAELDSGRLRRVEDIVVPLLETLNRGYDTPEDEPYVIDMGPTCGRTTITGGVCDMLPVVYDRTRVQPHPAIAARLFTTDPSMARVHPRSRSLGLHSIYSSTGAISADGVSVSGSGSGAGAGSGFGARARHSDESGIAAALAEKPPDTEIVECTRVDQEDHSTAAQSWLWRPFLRLREGEAVGAFGVLAMHCCSTAPAGVAPEVAAWLPTARLATAIVGDLHVNAAAAARDCPRVKALKYVLPSAATTTGGTVEDHVLVLPPTTAGEAHVAEAVTRSVVLDRATANLKFRDAFPSGYTVDAERTRPLSSHHPVYVDLAMQEGGELGL